MNIEMLTTPTYSMSVGKPVKNLPPKTHRGSNQTDWYEIARRCYQHEGLWVPFVIRGTSGNHLTTSASNIREGRLNISKHAPWEWDAAVRGLVLYIKYEPVRKPTT